MDHHIKRKPAYQGEIFLGGEYWTGKKIVRSIVEHANSLGHEISLTVNGVLVPGYDDNMLCYFTDSVEMEEAIQRVCSEIKDVQ